MTPCTTFKPHCNLYNTPQNTFFFLVHLSDLALVGIQAVTTLSDPQNKLIVVIRLCIDKVMTLTFFTVSHVPIVKYTLCYLKFFLLNFVTLIQMVCGGFHLCLLAIDKAPCILVHVKEGTRDLLVSFSIIDRLCHGQRADLQVCGLRLVLKLS